MDFSVFSDDNFDVKEWINGAFVSEEAVKNKEAYTGTLVMKLQLFIQEINNSLEESGQQVLQSIPRVLRDIEAIQQESVLLRDQMSAVKEQIKKVEHDTAQSMETLVKIDTIKNRMIDTNNALKEADNWTTLSADVEEVFKTGEISKISEKLVGMQQSLEILTDVPDYEDRCSHLEKLKDRLEAIISPQLIAALNSNSQDLAHIYVSIFKDINRVEQFWKYYHKCFKTQLSSEWQNIVSNDQDETVLDWLTTFYDKLLSAWHVQSRWCQQVIITCSSVEMITGIFSEVLSSLNPSVDYCIGAALKSTTPTSTLYLLCDLKQVSDRFAKSMQSLILATSSTSLDSDQVAKFVQEIYKPYKKHISKFGELEEKILFKHLQPIDLIREDALDSVRYFQDSISKVIGYVNEAADHCKRLTLDCSFPALLQAITGFFQQYSKKIYKVVDQLKVHVEAIESNGDWSTFQLTLQATQCCGTLLSKIENIEQDLVSSILDTSHHFGISNHDSIPEAKNATPINPFTNYRHLLLDEANQKKLQDLVDKVLNKTNCSVLPEVMNQIQKLCEKFCRLLFNMMFDPINKQLSTTVNLPVWTERKSGSALTDDLPSFSLSPQEYITQIGQHLITLPQHIEPFVMDDNPALKVALKNGKLPYILEQHSSHLSDVLLGSIAQGTAQTYCDTMIRIQNMLPSSVKQLVTDIEYLCNVLDDLGLKPNDNDNLLIVLHLLNSPTDQYIVVSHGKPAHLVNAVKRMRNL